MSAQLRLWNPDEPEQAALPWDKMRWDGRRQVPKDQPQISAGWRFSRWFLDYWVPWGLCAGEDPARDNTIDLYFDAARWAIRVAGDPCLDEIGEGWLSRIHGGLTEATYVRSQRLATVRPIAAATQAKHRRQLATCLRELTWQGLIKPVRVQRRARRRSGRVRPVPKPAFDVAQLRAIVAAAEAFPVRGFTGPRLRSLWRAIYGLAFYSGLRREALLGVTWAHVSIEDGAWWLRVPAEIAKDSDPWEGPLYPALVTELLAVRGELAKLLPWPYGPVWLLARHQDICRRVGLSGRGRDLQGLRRSHLQTLASAGFDAEKQALAALAGHSDASTTFGHYTPIGRLRAKYLPQMPAIW